MDVSGKTKMFGQRMPPRKAMLWVFPRTPLTLNKLLGAHWGVKTRDKKSWNMWVTGTAGVGTVRSRVKLKITVYRKQLQDPDNRVGSVKPLVDSLRRAGWLGDDSDKWLDLEVKERIDRKEPRTEVYWEVL